MSTAPASRIQLSADEHKLISTLDAFSKHLAERKPDVEPVTLRIAGGWVRDKLLGLPSSDLDVAISNMTGYDFALQFCAYVDTLSDQSKKTTVACIAANPEQSKHLETATAPVFNHDVDFVQLRSEEYGQGSRIPTGVTFGTPLQDSLRRDLTMNALFYNVHNRQVEDWTEKGLTDLLEKPLIRCPLPPLQTFLDDPLRILRCIRFASRYGFPLDPSICETVALPEIKQALREKVSVERVYKELEKMLKHPRALHAIRLIHQLGLYENIFGLQTIPSTVSSPLPEPEEQVQLSKSAADMLARLLPPPSTASTSNLAQPEPAFSTPLHDQLESAAQTSDPELRKRLYLAACLLPYQGITYKEKSKTVWLGEKFLREGLSVSNNDRMIISRLYEAAKLISNPVLGQFQEPSERVALGMLLRDPHVHDTHVGPTWQISIFFSLVLDLQQCKTENDQLSTIATYNSFVDRIIHLELHRYAFARPLLDGNEVADILGFKPGRATADLLNRVVVWQLDHPMQGKDECRSWFSEQWASGQLDVTPPSPPKKKAKKG